MIPPIKPGDPISARWLNQVARQAGAGPQGGWGTGVIASGKALARQQIPLVELWVATEDFESHEDVYRGQCRRYWRIGEAYAPRGGEEYVYAHKSGLSEGDVLHAAYNIQAGRWEALSVSTTVDQIHLLIMGSPTGGQLTLSVRVTDDAGTATESVVITLPATMADIQAAFETHSKIGEDQWIPHAPGLADDSVSQVLPSREIWFTAHDGLTMGQVEIISIDETKMLGGAHVPYVVLRR